MRTSISRPALLSLSLALCVGCGGGGGGPSSLAALAQEAYVKASNTESQDAFGCAVSISGDTMVVGAFGEDGLAYPESGAAYVFARTGTTWTQQGYLKASNQEISDSFGWDVAISGDTIVVGAPLEDSAATGVNGDPTDNSASASGAAYVFVRTGTTWSQQAYLKASNAGTSDLFGISVSISGDTVVVGASQEASNATGVNGNQADDSTASSGSAYVFVRTGTTWTQQAYLKASNTDGSDGFGGSVAIAGDTVLVGARGEASSATGVDGNQADNSAAESGAAYVFARSGTTWAQQAYLKASNTDPSDTFGTSVAIFEDTIVVAAPLEDSIFTGVNGNQIDNSSTNSGAAYVFVRMGTTWFHQAYLKASNTETLEEFGSSVAISGGTIVVGAFGEGSNATGVNGNQRDNSAAYSGAAYVFARTGTAWSQRAYLKASNTDPDDTFGHAVAISGGTILVGAVNEASMSTGVNGDEADDSAAYSGAAYVFR